MLGVQNPQSTLRGIKKKEKEVKWSPGKERCWRRESITRGARKVEEK